jgi:predicted transcriptional regulator
MHRWIRTRSARTKVSCRASASHPPGLHRELAKIAKQKKVSLAWVIRDAAEHYVEAKWPLLEQKA